MAICNFETRLIELRLSKQIPEGLTDPGLSDQAICRTSCTHRDSDSSNGRKVKSSVVEPK